MAARGHRVRSYAYENKYRKNLATGYAGISGAVLGANKLPKYTTTGTAGLTDSTVTDDGADVTIAATTGLIVNGVIKLKAGGANLGTITHVATVPRTWTFPDASGTVLLAGSAAASEIADNLFRVLGSADATKKLAFEVDGFTTGTTQTLTPPNASGTIVTRGGALTTNRLPKWDGTHAADSDLTDAGAGVASLSKSQNATTQLTVTNATSGTAALAGFYAERDGTAGVALRAYSASYTPSGIVLANGASLRSDSGLTAGMVIVTGAGPIIFGTSDVERGKVTDSAFYWKSGTTKRIEGDATGIGFNGVTPTAQGALSALTNNVTAGGSADTIADYSTADSYETVRATIRNDIHQLARYVKLIGDFLRLRGDMA